MGKFSLNIAKHHASLDEAGARRSASSEKGGAGFDMIAVMAVFALTLGAGYMILRFH